VIRLYDKSHLDKLLFLSKSFLEGRIEVEDYYDSLFNILGRNEKSVALVEEIIRLLPPSQRLKQDELYNIHLNKSQRGANIIQNNNNSLHEEEFPPLPITSDPIHTPTTQSNRISTQRVNPKKNPKRKE